MSGNFWKSSHFQQWLLDPQDIMLNRLKELQANNLKEDEYFKLMIFFTNFIQTLGENLRLRQQVIASATVYFRRFYSKYSLKCIDPCLLAPTCLFLATKVEVKLYVKTKYPHLYPQEYPYKIQHIWECEFYLLEVMDCCLILYHPYRPLVQFVNDLSPDDTSLLQQAWRVCNDSLRTDLCLMYPPSIIALGCLHIACVHLKKDAKQWFSELNIDMEKLFEVVRHIMHFYDLFKSYDEKDKMKEILGKIAKPRLTGSSSSSSSQQQSQSQRAPVNSQQQDVAAQH